jgi:hypothetical protein
MQMAYGTHAYWTAEGRGILSRLLDLTASHAEHPVVKERCAFIFHVLAFPPGKRLQHDTKVAAMPGRDKL